MGRSWVLSQVSAASPVIRWEGRKGGGIQGRRGSMMRMTMSWWWWCWGKHGVKSSGGSVIRGEEADEGPDAPECITLKRVVAGCARDNASTRPGSASPCNGRMSFWRNLYSCVVRSLFSFTHLKVCDKCQHWIVALIIRVKWVWYVT